MSETKLRETVSTLDEAEGLIPSLLKDHVSQGAFMASGPREVSEGRYVAEIGLTRPEVIWDSERENGTLSFLKYPSVSAIRLTERPSGIRIEIPPRADILSSAEAEEASLLHRVEKAIVDSTRQRLVEPAIVQNQMNPIREILVMVGEEGPIPRTALSENERYFRLLEDLRYIDIGESTIGRGPVLTEMLNRIDERPYLTMLGDILAEGYTHVTEELNLQHVNTFVHIAGGYFWPSQTLDRPLEFRLRDFHKSLERVYGSRTPSRVKVYNHVQSMTEAEIFRKEGHHRRATEDVWDDFRAEAPALS